MLAPVRIVDIGVPIGVQILQLRFLGVELALENDAAFQPGAVRALRRQRVAEFIHHRQHPQITAIVEMQLLACRAGTVVADEQAQAGQREVLIAAQQGFNRMQQLRTLGLAQAGCAQIPGKAIAQIYERRVRSTAGGVLVVGKVARAIDDGTAIDLHTALLQGLCPQAALQHIAHIGVIAAASQTSQAKHDGRRQGLGKHDAGAVFDVIARQGDAVVKHQRQIVVAARHPQGR